MGSIPLVATGIQNPPQNALQEYLRMAQLQQQNDALKQQTEQRAQAFPVAQQQAQATLEQTQLENQAKQQASAEQAALRDLAPKYVTRDDSGKVIGYDYDQFFNDAQGKVSPAMLEKLRQEHQTTLKNYADLDKGEREKEASNNKWLFDSIESLKGIADPAQRQAQYQKIVQDGAKRKIDIGQFPTQAPSNDELTALEAPLGMHAQILADAKTQAETNKANAEAEGPAAEREFQSYYKRWLAANKAEPSAANEYKAQQQYFRDKQPFGEQRLVIENRKLDQADERLAQGEQRIGVKDRDFIDKNYVKPANDKEQSYQMFQEAYNNRNNAKTGAESMLALSTHLATTFGNVKGARVTKDMIEHHLGARGITDKMQVAVQKLVNGDELSPDQWDAFKGLITNARNLAWQTAIKEAKAKNYDISGSLPDDLKPKSTSLVTMKAPNGATKQVPADQVDHYKSLGATVVSQ